MNHPTATVRSRGALPRWYEWVLGVVILLLAFGHFVVRPAAERFLQGVGGVATVAAAKTVALLSAVHDQACATIEQDAFAQAAMGGKLTCAPLEDAEWLPASDGQTVAFRLPVTSDNGQQATALVTARIDETGARLESIVLSSAAGGTLILPLE